jgi:hypothetical protein
MFVFGSRLVSANREERERARCVVLRKLQTGDTDTLAWGGNFKYLPEAIGRLYRGGVHRSSTGHDSVTLALSHPQMPTQLAREILLQFFRIDRTEMCETELFELYAEDGFAVQQALTELCDQDLLADVTSDCGDKWYLVTAKGQSVCFSCRD